MQLTLLRHVNNFKEKLELIKKARQCYRAFTTYSITILLTPYFSYNAYQEFHLFLMDREQSL